MQGRGAPRRHCGHRIATCPRARPQLVAGSALQPQRPRRETRTDSGGPQNAATARSPPAWNPGPCPLTLAAAEPPLGIPTVTAPLVRLRVSRFSASQ